MPTRKCSTATSSSSTRDRRTLTTRLRYGGLTAGVRSAEHLRLWIALLPEFQRLHARQRDHRAVVKLHFDRFQTVLDGLGEDELFFGAGHGGWCFLPLPT